MEIDLTEINEMLLNESNLTDREKEFIRDVNLIKNVCSQCVKEKIDGIIKRYAAIEADVIIDLYNKYIKQVKLNIDG